MGRLILLRPPGGTTPNPFDFVDQSGVPLSSVITSAPITVSGLGLGVTVAVTAVDGVADINLSGSFSASPGNVGNGDLVRTRLTSSDSNSTPTTSIVFIGGVAGDFTATTLSAGGSGVFFQPDVDAASSILDMFDDRNGAPPATISTAFALPGQTQSVRMQYTADEAGDDLLVLGTSVGGQFVATPSLFSRSYERFEGPWGGNWPQGLKTGRYFTAPNAVGCQIEAPRDAYVSEKIIYPGYETSPDPRLEAYVTNGSWAYCDPVGGRPEIESTYTSGMVFDNGLPYIRTGHWYKFERWYVLNSASGVADGIMRILVDDIVVLDRSDVVYVDNSLGIFGTNWMSMWFGGNYSNTGTFTGGTKDRYLSGFYLSSTLDL